MCHKDTNSYLNTKRLLFKLMAAQAATPEFKERVDRLKRILPTYYGVTVRREMPELKPSKLYNLLHCYTNNEELLGELELLFTQNK